MTDDLPQLALDLAEIVTKGVLTLLFVGGVCAVLAGVSS